GSNVIVLSNDAWRSKFGADSSIIGKTFLIRGLPLMVIGVAQHRFVGMGAVPTDFWAPITLLSHFTGNADPFGPGEPQLLRTVIRIKPGVTEHDALAQLTAWAGRTSATLPDSARADRAEIYSMAKPLPLTTET